MSGVGLLTSSAPAPAVPRVWKGRAWSPWVWMAVACTLLGASRGVRAWQDLRFRAALRGVEASPFPLNDLPKALGYWRLQEGNDAELDPKVLRIAGCSDHLLRTYVNELTGVRLTVVILFGPAEAICGHTPAICYPSAGYKQVEDGVLYNVPLGSGAAPAAVRSEVFSRGEGALAEREEVFHSFRYAGRWFSDAANSWKLFRHNPYMFKIQTQRRVSEHERRHMNNPVKEFLEQLLLEMERRLAPGREGRAA